MMFCFKSILQIWMIFIGFRDTNNFVNLGICRHEFKFTCRGYCSFTLSKHALGTVIAILRKTINKQCACLNGEAVNNVNHGSTWTWTFVSITTSSRPCPSS